MTEPMLAAFAGFFVAMALLGIMAAQLNRSRASAAFAVLMAVAAANAGFMQNLAHEVAFDALLAVLAILGVRALA